MSKVFNVLFLCTGNSARSILAESAMNKLGAGRFRAYSAGSDPRGEVHPMALELLGTLGFPTHDLRSKSWDEFAQPGAPEFDFIFTVCDNAAGEVCPIWLGHPITAHWGIDDPAAVGGESQPEAFRQALRYLSNRISLFLALPHDSHDSMSLAGKLREIGGTEGSTPKAKTMPAETVIYHNPACGTSRNTLAMIRATGIEPTVIEYLNTPPDRATLERLIAAAGLTPRALLREKGTPFAELGLADLSLSDNALLEAMLAHPMLINRPLVETTRGVRLCRPSEVVLELLPEPLTNDFVKEDGEVVRA